MLPCLKKTSRQLSDTSYDSWEDAIYTFVLFSFPFWDPTNGRPVAPGGARRSPEAPGSARRRPEAPGEENRRVTVGACSRLLLPCSSHKPGLPSYHKPPIYKTPCLIRGRSCRGSWIVSYTWGCLIHGCRVDKWYSCEKSAIGSRKRDPNSVLYMGV